MLTIDKFNGSLARNLILTYFMHGIKTARLLTELAKPAGAVVSAVTDFWLPNSPTNWKEATLIDEDLFLDTERRDLIKEWWLSVPRGANPPSWDIASTCTISGKKGLLLVKAGTYNGEFSGAGKPEPDTLNGRKNHDQIAQAISEAGAGLNLACGGFGLSRDAKYDLSCRFAWAWKLSSLGVPVAHIYLGFINVPEVVNLGQPFDSPGTWEKYIRAYAKGFVPDNAWNKKLNINGTSLCCLVRSMELTFNIK
jgi:hypothetical protein